MPYFKDADDVYANLGLFMRQLAVDPEMANTLKRVDTTFQLRLRNPDSVLTMRTPREEEPAQVDLGETTLQPEVVLQLDADTAYQFWLGQVNVAVALSGAHDAETLKELLAAGRQRVEAEADAPA